MRDLEQQGSRPLVSLVIPVYNAELYLEELFASILSQTYENIEIVCVNDGSKDGSLGLLRKYESADDRIVVVDNPNSGAAATRNVGVEIATGEYLCFVDSDDFIERDSIELLLDTAIENQADIVLFDIDFYNDETKEFSPHHGAIQRDSVPVGEAFKASDVQHFYKKVIGYTVNKFYRASFIKGLGLSFPEIGAHEDMPFTYIALSAANRIVYLDKTLYHYRRSREGSLSDRTNDQYRFMIEALSCFKDMLTERGLWEENEQNYLNYVLHMCLWKNNDICYRLAKQFRCDCRTKFFPELGVQGFSDDLVYDEDERVFFRRVRDGVELPFKLRRAKNAVLYARHLLGRAKRAVLG